ncbi:MAG: hypothetical protein PUF17_10405 [Lactimicrobium massiliense]|nr:hypothetical protein [Lactimicrobium massiliense]MDD6561356.1 hypothetical protein [Lactimicrobium massiliense]
MAYLDETGLKEVWSKMKDKMYPVGSIYMSVNSTSPATIYGGTWEQIKGKFLLAEDGSTYKAGTEGGEAAHKLTVNEMPSHSHEPNNNTVIVNSPYSNVGVGSNVLLTAYGSHKGKGGDVFTSYAAGGGVAHNNMPPYVAVYIWKRTA